MRIISRVVVCMLLCSVVFLGGCGESNPLIGKWENKTNGIVIMELTFSDKRVAGKTMGIEQTAAIEYKIEKNIVRYSDDGKNWFTVHIIDNNTIEMNGNTLKRK